MWTIRELLEWTQKRFEEIGIESPRVDAEYLLAHALQCSRMALYVRHAEVVDPEPKRRFRDYVRRRLKREPVAYIEGRRGFHALDLDLSVDSRVLIPRPETEHLVDWLLEELREPPAPPMSVLDVGTGSGAIALAVKRARSDVEVVASDRSSDAIEVARANAERLGLDVLFVVADLLEGVDAPSRGWAGIAANLPYVRTHDWEALAPEVRDFEPRSALDAGPAGLEVVQRLVEQAARPGVMSPGAGLYLEVGYDQTEATAALLREAGFEDVQTRSDYGGHPRIVRGFRPR